MCGAGVVFYNDLVRLGEATKGKYGALSQIFMMEGFRRYCLDRPLATDVEKRAAALAEMLNQYSLHGGAGPLLPAAAAFPPGFPAQVFPQPVFPQQAVAQMAPPPPPPGPPPAWGGAYGYGQQAAYGYAGPGGGQGGGNGNGASGSGLARGCWTCGRAGHWGGKCKETLDVNQKPLVPGAQAFKWAGPKPEGPK